MASTLATRDQENAVYGHQQAAASKPLNQLRPKTPGNKSSKVTFHDENALQTQGKATIRRNGNENSILPGKKSTIQDPATPTTRNRAPLAAKTTNAKARSFHNPISQDGEIEKAKNGSARRRNQVKVIQAQPVEADVLQNEDSDVPEIEYMPPRVQDLPDIPEELENGINLSMFENGGMQRDFFKHMWLIKGPDGKTALERDQERARILEAKTEAEDEATAAYMNEAEFIICTHDPDCPTDECKDAPERRQLAKDRLNMRLAEIRGTDKPSIYNTLPSSASKPTISRVNVTKGPTCGASRSAALALAMSGPKPAPPNVAKKSQTLQSSSALFGRRAASRNAGKPANPSVMRHTAAVVTSNTTLGYGKGRAARANLRQGILGPKDANLKSSQKNAVSKSQKPVQDVNTLPPAEYMRLYGEPSFLSEMWWKCKTAGLIKLPGQEDKDDINAALFEDLDVEGFQKEEAERDFELTLS